MSRKEEDRAPRVVAAQPHGPAAAITRRAADRLRAGHLWVYRSDIESLVPPIGATDLEPGALITVMDSRGIPLGTGLYSAASQIAVRIVSNEVALPRAAYLDQVRERVLAALALRDEVAPESMEDDACRLIFSEADGLPGIVADRYNDLVILQLLTQGTAQDDVRQVLTEVLREHLRPDTGGITLWERPDPKIRELEQLAHPAPGPLHQNTTESPQLTTIFTINGLRFHFDAGSGQKTGAFLDQRLNYAAAARYATGKALDICTYQGGFALHMAQNCRHVTGVDASRSALEVADRNRELNPELPAKVEWIEADAFELLREYESTGQQYDTIVLDPPAFAKSKRAAEGAMRGYKELNLRAMKMLRPGGTLITCSCSHHVPLQEFTDVVSAAASDTGRRVQLLETRGAAPDHPAILTLPETSYLKCLICRVG
ncbi:class I SAM-dependent rRNA methyltransferase [Tunturiibacter gelidoferens]|jgi:23S rRNA (cytosine1962-C5)-methyltransferase|uniref:23S rRNA (Cytosine1962-C5)-methyltransferase n=1 Tax=Tunturiibacter gelidiferens TaxID=3069689 RepID=A0A9X0U6L8_9BACT|nr:class I SAM-dependent rRNA methyltransferase [Edaphobacter lichenicola]MBB5331613.1 23S rRNA (cytosine1962-C5)-methyltransferase [Edaphobacter lichenicola]